MDRIQLIYDNPVLNRAWASLPGSYLYVKKITINEGEQVYGVFAKKTIPKRSQFGPIEGQVMKREDPPSDNFILLVEHDGVPLYMDTSDETVSNWMRFVRPADTRKEQNVFLVQQGQSLYFNTTHSIKPETELRVWYSPAYAEKYGLSILEPNEEEKKAMEEQENGWPCFECNQQFSTSEELQKHLNEEIAGNNIKPRNKSSTRAKVYKKGQFSKLRSLQHQVQQEKMEVDNLSSRSEEMIERGPQCVYTSTDSSCVTRSFEDDEPSASKGLPDVSLDKDENNVVTLLSSVPSETSESSHENYSIKTCQKVSKSSSAKKSKTFSEESLCESGQKGSSVLKSPVASKQKHPTRTPRASICKSVVSPSCVIPTKSMVSIPLDKFTQLPAVNSKNSIKTTDSNSSWDPSENKVSEKKKSEDNKKIPKVKMESYPETNQDIQFTYPPPPHIGGIRITNEDAVCLNEGEFLNDAIIDFYLKFVFYEKLSDYDREMTYIFSSYFYLGLTKNRERSGDDSQKSVQQRCHSMVKRWTRCVDIFTKNFIVIPINKKHHWFLAIICYPWLVPETSKAPFKPNAKIISKSNYNLTSTGDQEENKVVKESNSSVDGKETATDSSTHPDKKPSIFIFDSLNGHNISKEENVATMLREYLEEEWRMRKCTIKKFDEMTMQDFIMECPQQTNGYDCGIYLLQYVESFFESPLPYFGSSIPNLSNWFSKTRMDKKRQELKELILSLNEKWNSVHYMK